MIDVYCCMQTQTSVSNLLIWMAIYLMMVRCTKIQLRTQILEKTFTKSRCEIESLFDTITLVNPCNLNISFMNTYSMSLVLCVDLIE